MRRSRPKKKIRAKAKRKAAPVRAYRPAASADDEDRLLAAEARKALADPERIPYERVRRDLGLD